MSVSEKTCPECGGPLVRGTFCRACGWDGEVMDGVDDAYLDGVDLPQGYGDDEDDFDYEDVLRREGLLPREAADGRRASLDGGPGAQVLVAGVVLALIVIVALLSAR
ncbi:MAG: hypothetical protein KF878_14900 [Planctomycetes bacterium]|nr:hypothetical protein [Planctomycetota bacterium]